MWGIELQRRSGVTMARQLYQALRERMTQGDLKPGETLPSTRELAAQLGISRNTACEAYAMLSDEGYLQTSPGAPTRVAQGLALRASQASRASPGCLPSALPEPVRGNYSAFPPPERKYAADFRTGQPDLRRFPFFLWRQLLQKGAEQLPPQQLGYTGPEGLPALRQEIARWLLRGRGLEERPEDIFITAGCTQALHLLACLPSLRSGKILSEDPCHTGILRAWQALGAEALPVCADEHGLRTELLDGMDVSGARAVYVTPSHQFPIGGILPAGRRAELIRFARRNGLYIIEDDYDSEFRYSGAPIAPLRSMDRERVVYVGTFSKTLFPALRIGFVALPAELQDQWRSLRRYSDAQNPPFGQAALAEFLRTRKFDRHVRQMRKLYGQRRETLLRALEDAFGGGFKPLGDTAGLHTALQFPGMRFDEAFIERAGASGIFVTSMEQYALQKGEHTDKLILGYGHMEPEEIQKSTELLSGFLKSC